MPHLLEVMFDKHRFTRKAMIVEYESTVANKNMASSKTSFRAYNNRVPFTASSLSECVSQNVAQKMVGQADRNFFLDPIFVQKSERSCWPELFIAQLFS